MGIRANIISIDIKSRSCIITIQDDAPITRWQRSTAFFRKYPKDVVLKKNIGLELNEDGTADMEWVNNKIKILVFGYREKKKKFEYKNNIKINN